jgi:hypothetical protein
MLGIPEFALSLTLSLTIVVLALAAKIPAASYPPLIAGLISVLTLVCGPLWADAMANSLLLIVMGLSLPLIGILVVLWIIEMKV